MKQDDLTALPDTTARELVPVTEPRGKRRAENRRRAAFSDRTLHQYKSLWRQFVRWWEVYSPDRDPCTVSTEELTWYLAEREEDGRAYATLLSDYNAVEFVVRRSGRPTLRKDGVVAEYLQGFRRQENTEQKKKNAISPGMLAAMVDGIENTPIGLRNRALLLVGWCSAQRREELVRMTVQNLKLDMGMQAPGYRITIPFSKTDQEGKGRETMIHYAPDHQPCPCPCAALEAWLWHHKSADPEMPIFCGMRHNQPTRWGLTGHDVARTVKARCKAIGEDPALFGGHSLRAGFVTYMKSIGKTWQEIAAYTGHTNERTVDGYNRPDAKPYPGLR